MERRRPISEEDAYLTELLIAKSYGNLKQSVVQASSGVLSSVGKTVGGTVRKHPYAAAGAAVGAGILLFGLFTLMNRNGSSKGRTAGGRERRYRRDMATEILSLLMPIVTPYVTAYLEKFLGRVNAKDRG